MTKKLYIYTFLIFAITFCINHKITASAFNIETLDESNDLPEIQQLEEELLTCGMEFAQEGTSKEDLRIAYERAVKIYVDTNIFELEQLYPETLADILTQAVYLWEVPVELPTGGFVSCTVSRKPPIDEATQHHLLIQGIFTQEELNEQLARVGQWVIPAFGYDEPDNAYINRLEKATQEAYRPEDSNMIFLLGGTPNFRQPFGLQYSDGSYQIISINDTVDMTLQQASMDDSSLEEAVRQAESVSEKPVSSSYNIYSFEEVQKILSEIPTEQSGMDSGLGIDLEQSIEDGSLNAATKNRFPLLIAGIALLLIAGVTITCDVMVVTLL